MELKPVRPVINEMPAARPPVKVEMPNAALVEPDEIAPATRVEAQAASSEFRTPAVIKPVESVNIARVQAEASVASPVREVEAGPGKYPATSSRVTETLGNDGSRTTFKESKSTYNLNAGQDFRRPEGLRFNGIVSDKLKSTFNDASDDSPAGSGISDEGMARQSYDMQATVLKQKLIEYNVLKGQGATPDQLKVLSGDIKQIYSGIAQEFPKIVKKGATADQLLN